MTSAPRAPPIARLETDPNASLAETPTAYDYEVLADTAQAGSFAFGLDNLGRIVGSSGSKGWLNAHGALTAIDVPGSDTTRPYGLNETGTIVGFYSEGKRYRGFLYADAQYTTIDAPGADKTFLFGINGKGQIVGTYSTGKGQYAFAYTDGKFTDISIPQAELAKGRGIQAHGVNDLGQIVGFYNQGVDASTGRRRIVGFVLKDGAVTSFSVPGAYATEADGINNKGVVVGTYGTAKGGFGFVYDGSLFETLAVPGASKTEAQGIDDNGIVVGWAVIGRAVHAFVARPRARAR